MGIAVADCCNAAGSQPLKRPRGSCGSLKIIRLERDGSMLTLSGK